MSDVIEFHGGNYRYVKGVFQYSAGVAAMEGYEIVRIRFRELLPLSDAFSRVEAHLSAHGRPVLAFCACELRSPAPFTESGFASFNQQYVGRLQQWGLANNSSNPVARTNVCPALSPPGDVSMYAFSYTMPIASGNARTFVVAGSAEAPEGMGNYRDHAVRLGDRSVEGIRAKANWVRLEMERRMHLLGMSWHESTGASLYTVYDVHPVLEGLVSAGATSNGLTWHYSRPPVQDLDFEMDVRGVSIETVI
jgi:hypothetical protein